MEDTDKKDKHPVNIHDHWDKWINTFARRRVGKSGESVVELTQFGWMMMSPGHELEYRKFLSFTGCPNKNATFFTKLKAVAFCFNAKIFPDSERVQINLDFDFLASPVCQPFFEICQFKY